MREPEEGEGLVYDGLGRIGVGVWRVTPKRGIWLLDNAIQVLENLREALQLEVVEEAEG